MFEGFAEPRIGTRGAKVFALTGGAGPPMLLLHGYPGNHVVWHAVAPRLAGRFRLVFPDRRGYGEGSGPRPDPQHLNYSKRAKPAPPPCGTCVPSNDQREAAENDALTRIFKSPVAEA